jgi:hypothetical protein
MLAIMHLMKGFQPGSVSYKSANSFTLGENQFVMHFRVQGLYFVYLNVVQNEIWEAQVM